MAAASGEVDIPPLASSRMVRSKKSGRILPAAAAVGAPEE